MFHYWTLPRRFVPALDTLLAALKPFWRLFWDTFWPVWNALGRSGTLLGCFRVTHECENTRRGEFK